jgi:two-component system, LytTR family, sensor kinase
LFNSAIAGFVSFIMVIYSFYFFMFSLLFRRPITYKSIIYIILIIIILTGIQNIMSILIIQHTFKLKLNSSFFIFILIFGGIGLGARAILEYFKDKEKKKELERKNLQSELSLLRTQINPHFLFNTLNNIDALIKKEPAKASELLIKLSDEMRYMLYDSNTEKISLASEIDFIKGYISLQRSRFKNPNIVELKLDGDFGNIMIPPMLFIPFIENAFKHCNQPVDNAITIYLAAKNNELFFQSKNCFDPENKGNKDKIGGIGLELVKKRLELIYPKKHSFTITKDGNMFTVSLTIQLNGN